MIQEPEILTGRRGRAGIVTLNRPQALNALTPGMVRAIHTQLAAWAAEPEIALVVLRGAGGRAFCAGGDIRQLHDLGKANDPAMRAFYRDEYRLNAYIKAYPKPCVALIDGIVMGGGAGLSVHGSHRVAGTRTVFAMPETGIGFFPDVGATFFLPRLPGRIGTFMALTGARLGAADALWAGIATHFVPSERFDALTDALCAEGEAALARFAEAPGTPPLEALSPTVDRCFGGRTVEEILKRLDAETGPRGEWAAAQAGTLRGKSPMSLRIALRQMQEGADAGFAACMRLEYRIASRIRHGHDFYEGVRALIIDKDNAPQWRPDSLGKIAETDIDAHFAPLPDELDLSGLDRAPLAA